MQPSYGYASTMLTITVLAFAPTVAHAHDACTDASATTVVLGTIISGTYYAETDGDAVLVVYQETNGVPGLQRGDKYETTCRDGATDSDQIVWARGVDQGPSLEWSP